MKIHVIFLLLVYLNLNAQEKQVENSDLKKDENGISLTAPEGIYQYAFRIGEWDGVSKDLLALNQWKTNTSKHRFYVAENGLTYVEEGLGNNGEITHRITYDYIEATDSWDNKYEELATGKTVHYTSKITNGKMIETIKREDHVNHNDYTIVAPNIIIYTARRTYNNGFELVTHVGISTKNK
ncbi:MAG: hypothetical protein ACK5HT_12970 [Draconibacterium sp.]